MANNLLILIGAAAGAYYLFKDKQSTECRDGFKWDPELGACVQIPAPPVPPVNCPEGYRYDAESNSCVAIEVGADPVPPQCGEGFQYNATTGVCEQIPAPPEPTCTINDLAPVLAGARVISKGCKGKGVKELQTALVHFFELDLCAQYGGGKFDDGKFGPNTEKAVKAFQSAANLTRDGIVGKNTVGSLKNYFDSGQHTYAGAGDELADDARVIRDFQDARTPVTGGVCGLY